MRFHTRRTRSHDRSLRRDARDARARRARAAEAPRAALPRRPQRREPDDRARRGRAGRGGPRDRARTRRAHRRARRARRAALPRRVRSRARRGAEPRGRFRVPPSAFYPRPQVTSEVIRVRLSLAPRIPVDDPGLLRALVRAAFNQRRKMLRNALQTLPPRLALSADAWDEIFAATGIDGRARGETLDLPAFGALADAAGRALAAGGAHPRRSRRADRGSSPASKSHVGQGA